VVGAVVLAGGSLGAPLGLPVGSAYASANQESSLQDDQLLIYNSPEGTARTLDTLKGLGVDRVRVSVLWRLVAPDPLSRTRPAGFRAADPAAYPPGSWDRYDQVVTLARARGIAVNFNITAPAPFWATGHPSRADIENTYTPSSAEFGQFVQAVGTRYSGAYRTDTSPAPADAPPPAPSCTPGPLGIGGSCPSPPSSPPTGSRTPARPPALPRVDYWSLWNEPNQAGWLTPQWVPGPHGHGWAESSPGLYRGLIDAAYLALGRSGHAADTILIGETAPKGLRVAGPTRSMKLLRFVRRLYCLDDRYRPLRASAATTRGCPARPGAAFAREHPVLFAATGWAHHPYELSLAPNQVPPDPDFVTIANLPRLERVLDRALSSYHRGRPGGMPLFLTEFGFQTNPPNPAGVSLSQQAAFLNQSEYIAFRDRRVRALSQFLLQDDRPLPGRNGVTKGYGATFQTGLQFLGGRAKPSLAAYRMPIFLPHPRVHRGGRLAVWGMLRVGPGGPRPVAIQVAAPRDRGRFHTVNTITTNARGYLTSTLRLWSSARVRLAWTDPASGRVTISRVVDATAV
jgi:hypothetical protein